MCSSDDRRQKKFNIGLSEEPADSVGGGGTIFQPFKAAKIYSVYIYYTINI